MAIIDAVISDAGRDLLAKHLAGTVATLTLDSFRIGEGGFSETGGVKSPDAPDGVRTRLVSDGLELSGSVTFSNGSAIVTGDASALFLSEVIPGQSVRLDADLEWAEVATVQTDQQLTLTANYAGTGGAGISSVVSVPYFVFEKSFTGGDLSFSSDGEMSATAFLDFGEGNTGGYEGGNPEYFEIGVFDAAGNLVAYGTYPGETKTSSIQFNKVVRIAFSGA